MNEHGLTLLRKNMAWLRLLVLTALPRHGYVLVAIAAVLAGLISNPTGEAMAKDNALATSMQTIAYDIPAQALDSALAAYIKISGAQVFYENDLTSGLRSMPVKGQFPPDLALRTLLEGTGLVGRRTDIDAFIITSASREDPGASVTAFAWGSPFVSALQIGVLSALCRNSRTRPGNYKIAFELWIAPTGAVQRSALIGSTSDVARDAALTSALQGITVGLAPPIGMPQPIIMAVAPRDSGDCAGQ
jgi:hypothetical protein